MNARHQHRRTTREDIAYLEELLKCAKKKLAWEKQMEGVAKRTPEVLAKVSTAMNDATNPPEPQVRVAVLELLQTVQGAMGRLDAAKFWPIEHPWRLATTRGEFAFMGIPRHVLPRPPPRYYVPMLVFVFGLGHHLV
ncbi:MAG: hypothetical protein WDN28_07950 [Chthoniobacter sp.]